MQAFQLLSPGVCLREDPDPRAPRYSPRAARKAFTEAYLHSSIELANVWDPFCGSGTALSTIAVLERTKIKEMFASDIRLSAVETTSKNLSLCRVEVLGAFPQSDLATLIPARASEFEQLLLRYSCRTPIGANVFQHNALSSPDRSVIEENSIDIIVTDPPYGRL